MLPATRHAPNESINITIVEPIKTIAMPHIQCFPPIASASARILILGSMPGKESLRANQYYAHPRNAFWPIMAELIGAAPTLPYDTRITALKAAGIALWDVLAYCQRESSLDADIDEASSCANDFSSFFACHPNIRQVFFNGAMAEKCFIKQVLPIIDASALIMQRLPSTSPTNATMSFQQKLAAWRVVVAIPEGSRGGATTSDSPDSRLVR